MENHYIIKSILGVIQGFTEFLPVSSSGHLAVVNYFITGGISITLSTEIVLHTATVFAILVFFRKEIMGDIKNHFKPYFINILLSTFATVPVALLLKDFSEFSLGNIRFVGIFFIITSLILVSTVFFKGDSEIDWKKAIIIGISQGIAVIPGISRSGITIATALILGISPSASFKFSFYILVPAVFGGLIFETFGEKSVSFDISDLAGFLLSFSSGLLALYLLKDITIKKKLWYFSIYLVLIGVVLCLL